MKRWRASADIITATLLVGCSGEPRTPAPPPPPVAAEPRLTPARALVPPPVVRTTASVAVPPAVVSEELARAPKLVYRALDTGALLARSTLVTRTLQRFESEALLTVSTQISNSSTSAPVVGPFEAPAIRRYLGSATTAGGLTTFTLAEGDEELVLECAMGDVQVAAATAVRMPSHGSECGDRGRWVPLSTKRARALRCGIDDSPIEPMVPPDRREEMAFVPLPGIELLFVNDDCVMQGGGYRFVGPNGEVAAIRPGAL